MTTIKLTCISCGDIQLLTPEDIALELDADGMEGQYRFRCATCIEPQLRPASARVVTILLATGVGVQIARSDPITEHEIAAFVATLDAESDPLRLLAH